jgi:hypothetical protein
MLPQAEMSTAGVIIAVKTAIAEAESMTRFSGFYKINPVKSCPILSDASLDLKKQ